MNGVPTELNDSLVKLTIAMKLQQLQRESLSSLTYENLIGYLDDTVWKYAMPSSLHEIVDQILSTEANDIVRYLSRKAVIDGANQSLSDFADLIGGE